MVAIQTRQTEVEQTFRGELAERVGTLERLLDSAAGDEGLAGGELSRALISESYILRCAALAAGQAQIEAVAAALQAAVERIGSEQTSRIPGRRHSFRRVVSSLMALLDSSPPAEVAGLLELLSDPVPVGRGADRAEEAESATVVPVEGRSARTDSVRVAVSKLDALLAQAGELAVANTRIEERLGELRELRRELDRWRRELGEGRAAQTGLRRSIAVQGPTSADHRDQIALLRLAERTEERTLGLLQRIDGVTAQLARDRSHLSLVSRAIGDEVMAVRLLPTETLVGPLERLVRDLTGTLGKEARLVFDGGDTEIDRKILEQLRDPLMHLVRNALDHGIETPVTRAVSGKPATGTIHLTVAQRGGQIELAVEDDGAGLDPERLRQGAARKGILSAERALTLSDQDAFELIFYPGFSTASTLSQTSGRGVGLDVVREHVERLGGLVEVTSRWGQGVRFTLSVPITLATTRAIVVEQSGQTFAIPSATIERNARVRAEAILSVAGCRAVEIGSVAVPVVELAALLELTSGAERPVAEEWRTFFVLRQGERRLALLADRLVGEREIVVKSLGWPLRRVRHVGGAAVLGSGQTVIILNPSDLLKGGLNLLNSSQQPALPRVQPVPERQRKRVLLVDDSLMTRTLERSILEAAGYDTVVSGDGVEALATLRQESVDLVISDVEMPRLDGFGLTAEMRRDDRLRHIPVILITSLEAREHRERGMEVGADAYIVKSAFDQGELLDVVGRLL